MRHILLSITMLMLASAGALANTADTADTAATATSDTLATTRQKAVVVTGTRSEKLLAETPVRTELVTRSDMQSYQARSFADACEFTPGLRILNGCQNCNFSTLSMLGLEGKYSQVLYDGQAMFNGLSLVYGLEQIPARLIDRIEVVKGGGSSVYGPGAVGGVVNIIPHTPLRSGVSASASIEDMDGVTSSVMSFNADVVSEDGLTSATIFGQGGDFGEYDRNDDGFSDIGRRETSSFGARVVRELSNDGRLTMDYSRIYEDRRGGDNIDSPPFNSDIAEWIRTWRNTAAMTWSQTWSDVTSTKLALSYADTDRKTYYGGGGDTEAYGDTDNPMVVADLQINHYLGDHAVTWGVQHTSDHLEDGFPGYDRAIDETFTNTGVFLQDDWQVTEPLALVLGLRGDNHSELDDMVLSPRAAVRYDLAENLTLRGSFSTGFLAPQVFDEDLHIAVAGGEAQVIRNSDDLTEESSQSYTLGIEATPELWNGFGRFELNAFRTELTDAYALTEELDNEETPELELTRVNAGDAEVQGVEATAGWMNNNVEFQIGWIFQSGEYDEAQDFDETDFFRLPTSYGTAQFRYTNPQLVNGFLGARITGEEKIPHYAGFIADDVLETTDTMVVIDFSLSRPIWFGDDSITLTVGGKNITDEYQEDLDEGADRDTGYLYGPRFPRTWFATVGYDF